VTVGQFLVFIGVGAGAVALWLHTRFPRFTPKDTRDALLHVGVSLVIGYVAVPLLMKTIVVAGSPLSTLVAIFGVGFPALTYCLLASIWIIQILQGSLRHR
jgi:hypothetical protein